VPFSSSSISRAVVQYLSGSFFFSSRRLNLRPEKSLMSLGLHKAQGFIPRYRLTTYPCSLPSSIRSTVISSTPMAEGSNFDYLFKVCGHSCSPGFVFTARHRAGCPNRRLGRRKVVSISFILSPHFGSHELLRE